jgi:hypothetical protein
MVLASSSQTKEQEIEAAGLICTNGEPLLSLANDVVSRSYVILAQRRCVSVANPISVRHFRWQVSEFDEQVRHHLAKPRRHFSRVRDV